MVVLAAQVSKGKREEIEEKGGNISTVSTGIAFITLVIASDRRSDITSFGMSQLDEESG